MLVDVIKALPARFFSRPRGFATGLAIGIVMVGGIWTFNGIRESLTPDPAEAPACYGATRHQSYVPKNEPVPLRGAPGSRGERPIDERYDQLYLEQIAAAEKSCNATACSREAFNQYRSAVFWYLSRRMQHTSMFDREHGDRGLRRAREIYSEPADIKFERGLRERYRAKAFRINDFTQDRDAVAILALKDGSALRPCRKTDIASK